MKMSMLERIMIPEGIRIPVFGGVWYKFISRMTRKCISSIPIERLTLNTEKRDVIITCTLTSFPARIDSVQQTIKSLFNQSMKPDRIVLWLAEDEFAGKEMPDSIKQLMKQGLEVQFCENLYGHKRYYKLIQEQKKNEIILMFDDDILFSSATIERLYSVWKKHPDCIVCDRGQSFTLQDGKVINPGRWSAISDVGLIEPSFRILASPGGGCLIPYGALCKDAYDVDKIKKYAIKTGDIWLMFMAVENDTKIIRTYKYHRIFVLSEDQQSVQLGREAIYNGRYEQTFADLSKAYPHAFQNMMSELEK